MHLFLSWPLPCPAAGACLGKGGHINQVAYERSDENMELVWSELPGGRLIYSGVAQAVIEGELPPPEGRMVKEVLCCSGEVSVASAAAEAGAVTLQGEVKAELICSDGEVFAFTSRAQFSHAIPAPGAEPGMDTQVCPALQSLEIREENGRLCLSAVADLACRVCAGAGRALSGIKAPAQVEYQARRLELGRKAEAAAGTLRIREEIDAPFASRVVYAQLQAQIREATPTREGILLEGTLHISALVEGRTGALSQLTHSAPFSELVEGEAQGPLSARAYVRSSEVRAAEEFGVVVAEAELCYSVCARQAGGASLILDAFSPEMPFECSHAPLCLSSYEGGIAHRHPITETVALPEGMPEIQRVAFAAARPLITAQGLEQGELRLEGLLAVRILYTGEGGGIFAFGEDLPFALSLPAPGADEALVWACAAATASGGGRAVELTATVSICAELFARHELCPVSGIQEAEPREAAHGLMAYFAAPGDTLYGLAKRYNTSRAAIQAMCPGLEEELHGGEKIVFLN